jgi:hypothetical protein
MEISVLPSKPELGGKASAPGLADGIVYLANAHLVPHFYRCALIEKARAPTHNCNKKPVYSPGSGH